MLNLTVTLTGLDEALADIDRKFEAAKGVVTEDLRWFGQAAKEEMIATHTFQNRTFRLERSIDFDVVPFDYVTVFALTWYAAMVEFGVPGRSRPYPFFWPVFYKWLELLMEKLRQDWPGAFDG